MCNWKFRMGPTATDNLGKGTSRNKKNLITLKCKLTLLRLDGQSFSTQVQQVSGKMIKALMRARYIDLTVLEARTYESREQRLTGSCKEIEIPIIFTSYSLSHAKNNDIQVKDQSLPSFQKKKLKTIRQVIISKKIIRQS